jgi:hypothetical protein
MSERKTDLAVTRRIAVAGLGAAGFGAVMAPWVSKAQTL